MSDSFQFNQLYESVRVLGLPYEIKESGGSVIIKIASNANQTKFRHTNEKFRFLTTRTFNGSSNQNWRTPISLNPIRTSFPDISFFRSTPPPHTTSRPPPPRAAPPPPGPGPVVTPTPVSSAEPNQILHADSTFKPISTTTAMSSSTSTSLESPEHLSSLSRTQTFCYKHSLLI